MSFLFLAKIAMPHVQSTRWKLTMKNAPINRPRSPNKDSRIGKPIKPTLPKIIENSISFWSSMSLKGRHMRKAIAERRRCTTIPMPSVVRPSFKLSVVNGSFISEEMISAGWHIVTISLESFFDAVSSSIPSLFATNPTTRVINSIVIVFRRALKFILNSFQ